jgi:DedD protein
MAEQPEVSDNQEGAGDLRGKLIGRLAMAGLLVALLLGVLAFFDHLANSPEEPDERVFTERVPVAPKKEMSQPVKPAENLPESPAPEKAEPPVEPPPPPQVEAKPQVAAAPEAAPEKRPAGVIAKPAPAALPPPAVPEATTAPSNIVPPPRAAAPSEAEPARPVAQVLDHKPAPAASPPSVSRLFSGFLLQAGVFTSVQRAEELHARLTLSGVPSTLETRVQVGPFRTKQEAEAAQAKLKELGVETILVPPKGKN